MSGPVALLEEQVVEAARQVLAAVVGRNGEPEHRSSQAKNAAVDAFLAWDNGTFFRWATTPERWYIGVREKGRAWPAPRWLVFERLAAGGFAQLPVGSFPRPAFAITEDRELVEVQVSDVRSGLYFLSTCDLSRVHQTREGSGARSCELCLEPVEGAYVERVHRQGGDQRRSHLSCAQAAIDGVLREQLEEADEGVEVEPIDDRAPTIAAGPELRDEAIDQVEENADPSWVEAATRIAEDLAVECREFTTDAVWERLDQLGVETHEPRAMGSIMRDLARRGIVTNSGRVEKSTRPECHARPCAVWVSSIPKPHAGSYFANYVAEQSAERRRNS